jgi:hypothetical protein
MRHISNAWSLSLRAEHRFRVSENGVLRRIFGPKREKVREDAEIYIMRNSVTCTLKQILLT